MAPSVEMGSPDQRGQELTIGSLCTGIGGLDLAAEAHFGAELAWYSEIEPAPCEVLRRIYPDVKNHGDLTLIDWSTIAEVDIITAGYPCPPFSSAGKRKGAADVRHLWPHIAEAVRVLRPRYVVLENVRGHLSLGFDAVLGDLAEARFDAEWCLLRASEVGACHQRARIFVLARDADRPPEDAHAPLGTPRRGAGEPSGDAAHPDSLDDHGSGPTGPSGRDEPTDGGEDAPDAHGERLPRRQEHDSAADQPRVEAPQRDDADGLGSAPTDPAGRRGADEQVGGATSGQPLRAEPGASGGDRSGGAAEGVHDGGRPASELAWGPYAEAIDRWERILGRPAPAPRDEGGRLSPHFVEWMMGYPEGWTDGLIRTARLKALGNAVVPQQALAALAELATPDVAGQASAVPLTGRERT